MKDRVILDLCGGTGAWSKPYADAGYDVRVITLPAHDVMDYEPPTRVHGILAAPPCTMLSFARSRAKIPRDFYQGMALVKACLWIIWEARSKSGLKWWALENPRGYLRQFLGNPSFTFKPCEFGDPWAKVTDLWGYFQEPKKLPESVPVPIGNKRSSDWHDCPRRQNGNVVKLTRQEARALTPPGFAKAFFEANL